jgi:hypothetical protein
MYDLKFFLIRCLFTFDPLESIFDESKDINYSDNFVFFSSISLKMLSQFLFESDEIIFNR